MGCVGRQSRCQSDWSGHCRENQFTWCRNCTLGEILAGPQPAPGQTSTAEACHLQCAFLKKSTAKWINGQEVSADKCPLQVWWVIPFFRSNCSIEGNAFSRLSFFFSSIFGGIYKKVANKKNRDTWYQMLKTSLPYSQKVLVKNGNLRNSRKIALLWFLKCYLNEGCSSPYYQIFFIC